LLLKGWLMASLPLVKDSILRNSLFFASFWLKKCKSVQSHGFLFHIVTGCWLDALLLQQQNIWAVAHFRPDLWQMRTSLPRVPTLRLAFSNGPNRVSVSLSLPPPSPEDRNRSSCVLLFLQYLTMDKFQKPNDLETKMHICAGGGGRVFLPRPTGTPSSPGRKCSFRSPWSSLFPLLRHFPAAVSHLDRGHADRVRHFVSRPVRSMAAQCEYSSIFPIKFGGKDAFYREDALYETTTPTNGMRNLHRALCCASPQFRNLTKRRHKENTFSCNLRHVKGRKGWGHDSKPCRLQTSSQFCNSMQVYYVRWYR
jgi:hypothetical protein